MMQRIRWFLLILGIIVLLVVALANQKLVEIKIPLLFAGEVNVSTLLLASTTLGFLFGALMTAWMLRSHRKSKAAAADVATTAAADPADPSGDTSAGES